MSKLLVGYTESRIGGAAGKRRERGGCRDANETFGNIR